MNAPVLYYKYYSTTRTVVWIFIALIIRSSAVVSNISFVAALALSNNMPAVPATNTRRNSSYNSNNGERMTTTTTITSTSSTLATNKTLPLSLGAKTLRSLVLDAAQRDEEETLDLNGIMWLEHINLVIGSRELAIYFYLDFLGMTPDASTSSFHVNLGQQQFHLAEEIPGETAAQKITGSIGLVVPSLTTIQQRLETAQNVLAGTQFAVLQDDSSDESYSTSDMMMMTIRCPWGNIFHLYSAKADDDYNAQQQQSILTPVSLPQPKMIQLHASPGGAYSASRMTIRGSANPGIRYVEITCRPGTVSAIVTFYREMMSCTVSTTCSTTTTSEETDNTVAAPVADNVAIVCVGPGVHLVFVENDYLTDYDLQQMQGVHLCIYTAPSFQHLYQKLSKAHLIWTNPRFIHLDCCDTWQQAAASRTLRFRYIIDLNSGEKILELEHETRPSRHGQFYKALNYEPK